MDYLEFIDLDVFDGNINTVDVLPDSIEQRNNANYLSAPIGVRAGIPIGARDQLTNFIFVSATWLLGPLKVFRPTNHKNDGPTTRTRQFPRHWRWRSWLVYYMQALNSDNWF